MHGNDKPRISFTSGDAKWKESALSMHGKEKPGISFTSGDAIFVMWVIVILDEQFKSATYAPMGTGASSTMKKWEESALSMHGKDKPVGVIGGRGGRTGADGRVVLKHGP